MAAEATARLNIFQRLLRQWDVLHPYNAAQVLHLTGAPHLSAIEQAWHEMLRELGLGSVHVHGREFRFEQLNGDDSPRVIDAAESSLDELITRELNRPFAANEVPFRAFVVPQAGSCFAGVIYQHWVADSASIRQIMREWFLRLFDPSRARRTPLVHADGGYWKFFGPDKAKWGILPSVMSSITWSTRMKRVRRVENRDFQDFTMSFSLHETPPQTIERVIAAARKLKVTVNDIFLAAIARACHQFGPSAQTAKRPDLCLGTIVDLRSRGNGRPGEDFGLFLGFTSVLVRPEDLEDSKRLIERIAAQNRLQKDQAAPQASMIRLSAAVVAGSIFSSRRIKDFYRKRFPLAGGISNVNMNQSWAREYHPAPLLNYIRVSPTGPAMPLVFTTTTLGERLHFGLTCRSSVVPDDRAQRLAAAFKENLQQISAA